MSKIQEGNSIFGSVFPHSFKIEGIPITTFLNKNVLECTKLINAKDPSFKIISFAADSYNQSLVRASSSGRVQLKPGSEVTLISKYLELSKIRISFLSKLCKSIIISNKQFEMNAALLSGRVASFCEDKAFKAVFFSKSVALPTKDDDLLAIKTIPVYSLDVALAILNDIRLYASNKSDLEVLWVSLVQNSYYEKRVQLFVDAEKYEGVKDVPLKTLLNACNQRTFEKACKQFSIIIKDVYAEGFFLTFNVQRGMLVFDEYMTVAMCEKINEKDLDKLSLNSSAEKLLDKVGLFVDMIGALNGTGGQLRNESLLLPQAYYGKRSPSDDSLENVNKREKMYDFAERVASSIIKSDGFINLFKEKMSIHRVVLKTNPAYPLYSSSLSTATRGPLDDDMEEADVKVRLALMNPNVLSQFAKSIMEPRKAMTNFLIALRRLKPHPPSVLVDKGAPLLLIMRARNPKGGVLVFALIGREMICIGATSDLPAVRSAYGMSMFVNVGLMEFMPPFEAFKNTPVGFNFDSVVFGNLLKTFRTYNNSLGPPLFLNIDGVKFDMNIRVDVEQRFIAVLNKVFEGPETTELFFLLLRKLSYVTSSPQATDRDLDGLKSAIGSSSKSAVFLWFKEHGLASGGFHTPIINMLMCFPVWLAYYTVIYNNNLESFIKVLLSLDEHSFKSCNLFGINGASGDDVTAWIPLCHPKIRQLMQEIQLNFDAFGLEITFQMTSNLLRRSVRKGNFNNELVRATLISVLYHEKSPKEAMLLNLGVITKLSRLIGSVKRDPYGIHILWNVDLELKYFIDFANNLKSVMNLNVLMPQVLSFLNLQIEEAQWLLDNVSTLSEKEKYDFYNFFILRDNLSSNVKSLIVALDKLFMTPKDLLLQDIERLTAEYLGVTDELIERITKFGDVNEISDNIITLFKDKFSLSSFALVQGNPKLMKLFEAYEHSIDKIAEEISTTLGVRDTRSVIWHELKRKCKLD